MPSGPKSLSATKFCVSAGNFAAAQADINGVKGIHLTELGYDIRKPRSVVDPSGSQCGAGAPRFDVITSDNVDHFVGCNSPTPGTTAIGLGWLRLRYNTALAFPPILPTDTIKSITIIFDEGQDVAPWNFGLAVLDNIEDESMTVRELREELT